MRTVLNTRENQKQKEAWILYSVVTYTTDKQVEDGWKNDEEKKKKKCIIF